MLSLSPDSVPKFITFLGVAIVSFCIVQQHALVARVEAVVTAVRASQAEELELWKQQTFSIQTATEHLQAANDLFAQSRANIDAGNRSLGAAQRAAAEARSLEAKAEFTRRLEIRSKIEAKSVEVARSTAIADSLVDSAATENLLYILGTTLGALLLGTGLTRWVRKEREKRGCLNFCV
jgi:hypothetical protein